MLNKETRYQRLFSQIEALLTATDDPDARMATVIAVLHHKMDYFFWTGLYFLKNGELTVKMYQGAVACQILKKHTGVCWAGIDQRKTIIVPDVSLFPGHIACNSKSRSEIVLPIRDREGRVFACLDVDSDRLDAFDREDEEGLKKILSLLFD